MRDHHQGYVQRINSKAIWLVMTHEPEEIKQVIADTRKRMGDVEADDLRETCKRHWKSRKRK